MKLLRLGLLSLLFPFAVQAQGIAWRKLGVAQLVDIALTVVTLPHVGHFVLRDAPARVIPVVRNWLAH